MDRTHDKSTPHSSGSKGDSGQTDVATIGRLTLFEKFGNRGIIAESNRAAIHSVTIFTCRKWCIVRLIYRPLIRKILGELDLGYDNGHALGVRKLGRPFNVYSGANSGCNYVVGCWSSFGSQVPIDASSSRVQSEGRGS